jgi:hypothetical protein
MNSNSRYTTNWPLYKQFCFLNNIYSYNRIFYNLIKMRHSSEGVSATGRNKGHVAKCTSKTYGKYSAFGKLLCTYKRCWK